MAFKIDTHLLQPAPLAQRLRQRGQQQVVDLRAVRGGRVLKQRLGRGAVQRQRHALLVTDAVRTLRIVARQGVAGRQCAPVIQFRLIRRACGFDATRPCAVTR
ncbi:hypothetical protein D3C72_1644190 [compost metagenome]